MDIKKVFRWLLSHKILLACTLFHMFAAALFLKGIFIDSNMGACVYIAEFESWLLGLNIAFWVFLIKDECVKKKTSVGKKKSNFMPLKRIFLTIGVIIFISGLNSVRRAVAWRNSHAETTAVVFIDDIDHYSYIQHLKSIRYTIDGKEYTLGLEPWYEDKCKVGETVKIVYNKNEPYDIDVLGIFWSEEDYLNTGKREIKNGHIIAAFGLLIILLCRKAAKGYFKDWISKHSVLSAITLLHLLMIFGEFFDRSWDTVGLILVVEWWFVPLNIGAWIIAAICDAREYAAEGRLKTEWKKGGEFENVWYKDF